MSDKIPNFAEIITLLHKLRMEGKISEEQEQKYLKQLARGSDKYLLRSIYRSIIDVL